MFESLKGFWTVTFLISLSAGLIYSSEQGLGKWDLAPCDKPMAKIEYVMPGFQVGCWLGKPWSQNENEK
jgi:hypothetical protein